MGVEQKVVWNIEGGQINIASGNAKINANQNNDISTTELDDMIKRIFANLSDLEKRDAEGIKDAVSIAKEELAKTKPEVSRLRNCLTLLAPMMTVANGMPVLAENIQKLQDYIIHCIG